MKNSTRDDVEFQNIIPSHTLSQPLLSSIRSQVPLGNTLGRVCVDFIAKNLSLSAPGENVVWCISPQSFQCCISLRNRRWRTGTL